MSLMYHLFMLYYKKLLTYLFFSDEDSNKDGEDREEEGWEQVDVDEAEEEMAKKRPLLLHLTCQARLVLLHSKRHRPLPALRKT